MRNVYGMILLAACLTYSIDIQTATGTNFIEYYSVSDQRDIYPSISLDTKNRKFAIELFDLETETKLEAFDIEYLFAGDFTNGWSGVNKFVVIEGLVKDSDHYVLLFLNNGSGTGIWDTFKGYYAKVFFVDLNTEKKLFEDRISPDLHNFKSFALRFTGKGLYMSGKCQNSSISIAEIDFLVKLNEIDYTGINMNKKTSQKIAIADESAHSGNRFLLNGKTLVKNRKTGSTVLVIH